MNQLPLSTRTQIISLLVEGNSLRAITRITGCSINTVTKLLVNVGAACQEYHNKTVKELQSKRVQCDEIWSFVYAKQKNLPVELKSSSDIGDVWTWVGIDADSKLVVSWLVGDRGQQTANIFMGDIASRINGKFQLSTDGLQTYVQAVEQSFGNDVDYGQVVKTYGVATGENFTERKYSPSTCTGVTKETISGTPKQSDISTSYVERQNLTMRMHMRRFTRLTNAFSKKIENHCYAVALHFMYYNFVKIHKTIRVTPAMEAGLTQDIWSVEDLVRLTDK